MGKNRLAGFRQMPRLISVLLYGLSTVLVFLVQTAPHLFPSVAGIRPALLIPFVVCTAVLSGARVGAAVGVASGLLWGVFSARVYGLEALLLLAVGVVAGLLVEWLLRTNLWTALLLSASATGVAVLLEWLTRYVLFRHEQVWTVLWRVLLPHALYTVLMTPLLYGFCLLVARQGRALAKG